MSFRGANKEVYEIWFGIELFHDYYVKTPCPVSLVPSRATERILQKLGLIFIAQNANKWIILREKRVIPEKLLEEGYSELSFEIRPKDKRFYYLSEIAGKTNPSFSILESSMPNIWKTVKVSLEYLIKKNLDLITLQINSLEKYYEYICIPKYSKADMEIELVEEREKIEFKPVTRVTLPGISTAFGFVTKKKVKLTQEFDFRLQLWEIKQDGKQLISEQIPVPIPEQHSMINPKDTLTTYFYY